MRKISRVHIENFRSIKGPLDLDFSNVNALVGGNNVGKSNVLDVIKRVIGSNWVTVNTFEERDVYLNDPNLDIVVNVTVDPPMEYTNIQGVEPIKIKTLSYKFTRYKIGQNTGQRRLEKACIDTEGKSNPIVLAKKPKKGAQNEYRPLVGIPQEISDQLPLIFIGSNRELKYQLPDNKYSLLRRLLEDIDADFHRSDNLIEDGNGQQIPKSEAFNSLMEQAIRLLRTEEFSALEKSIKGNALRQLGLDPEEDSDKLDIFFSPFSSQDFYKALRLFVKEYGFSVDATELGGGIQNALVISILQTFEERKKQGAIFLIEEPEMYLHPQMQRSLYKTLRKIGETNQIIYSTHSPHFVTIPEYDEVTILVKDKSGTDSKVSNLPIDAVRREKIRKELDPERNELFFAKCLLLVEGDTEKMALPEYAKKMGIDFDNKGVTIVEVGVKRVFLEFANIAVSFGIKTGVIYDKDSSDFFSDEKKQEEEYNASLDSLSKNNTDVKVWKLENKYEDKLRESIGEEKYQKLCQKYPSHSKPIKQRLIAMDTESGNPDFVEEIVKWSMGELQESISDSVDDGIPF